jgi:hypothetical protein
MRSGIVVFTDSWGAPILLPVRKGTWHAAHPRTQGAPSGSRIGCGQVAAQATVRDYILQTAETIEIIALSTYSGGGLNRWYEWLQSRLAVCTGAAA